MSISCRSGIISSFKVNIRCDGFCCSLVYLCNVSLSETIQRSDGVFYITGYLVINFCHSSPCSRCFWVGSSSYQRNSQLILMTDVSKRIESYQIKITIRTKRQKLTVDVSVFVIYAYAFYFLYQTIDIKYFRIKCIPNDFVGKVVALSRFIVVISPKVLLFRLNKVIGKQINSRFYGHYPKIRVSGSSTRTMISKTKINPFKIII